MQVGQTCERGEVDAGLFDEALEGWGVEISSFPLGMVGKTESRK